MSWNFRKVGKDKAALKAAVQAESAPAAVKDHVCELVEGVELQPHQVIVVMSSGHWEIPSKQPTWGESTEKTQVMVLPFIDTPVA